MMKNGSNIASNKKYPFAIIISANNTQNKIVDAFTQISARNPHIQSKATKDISLMLVVDPNYECEKVFLIKIQIKKDLTTIIFDTNRNKN
jgi:hypothetical protein